MRCPRCSCLDDKVIDSRATKEGAGVRRRRECLQCGYRFTTHEEIIQAELKVVKRDHTLQEFDREKMRRGVERACWKRPISTGDIDSLVARVCSGLESDFEREVSSAEIGDRLMRELYKLDKVAYIRFASIYRDFQNIGEFITEVRSLEQENA